MTAAVILEEVDRRTLVPRDMISLRLLVGMEVNEQMDTHKRKKTERRKESWMKEKKGK